MPYKETRNMIIEVKPPDPHSLREWWHSILRTKDRYACYATLLALPSDEEAIRYVTEFGNELDLLSGEDCLIIVLSKTAFRRSDIDEKLWSTTVNEHVKKGHCIEFAKIFDISFNKFPCLVVFNDIRSPLHTVISLKALSAEEISDTMRLLFSIIHKAVASKEKPLTALEQHKSHESFIRNGRAIVGKLRMLTEKSFNTAMEAWIKASLK